eukprot:8394387-Pyramimonas_sp.AAC.1
MVPCGPPARALFARMPNSVQSGKLAAGVPKQLYTMTMEATMGVTIRWHDWGIEIRIGIRVWIGTSG